MGSQKELRCGISYCGSQLTYQTAAKNAIHAKDIEKRRRRKGKTTEVAEPAKKEKKRVGFA